MIEVVKWSLLHFGDRGRPCKLCNNKKSVKYKVIIRHTNRSRSKLIAIRVCNICMARIIANKEISDESSKIEISEG